MRVRSSLAIMLAVNLTHVVNLAAGAGVIFCEDSMACVNLPGYTCKNERCVCDPGGDNGLFPCRTGSQYGEKCRVDEDCSRVDENLICSRTDSRTCRCQRGLVWDEATRKCYLLEDTFYDTGSNKFDPVRDLIIPGIIVMTIGAMVYLGIKLFCNCGKLWRRRRRRPDLPREVEESHPPQSTWDSHPQQATWVASYRVFSSLNGVEPRSSPVLSPSSSFPLHPTPCMGLFLPTGSLATSTSPPSYEESLKHKVILSSYPLTVVLPPDSPPTTSSANTNN
ncbi:uncharacterized protein [Anabrus simplex]|uniref:uncharacterized protein n=1 Tax=Anabrus simplex TaxID=316456 RepID=UPI0034DCD8C4